MHGLTPLNAIAPLRTELTGSAEAPSATVPSSELTFPDNDIWAYLERRSSPILALASLVATVATVVLIIQCFRALHSDKKLTSLRMNGRTLAEGGSGSCNVGFPQHVHGMYVTQTASRAHIELVYVWWLAIQVAECVLLIEAEGLCADTDVDDIRHSDQEDRFCKLAAVGSQRHPRLVSTCKAGAGGHQAFRHSGVVDEQQRSISADLLLRGSDRPVCD
ncbi:uncharacterized protein EMH_0044320 [Eimeria mitis]|uniref:Uncharacterized protein n=1 Tax=Eimeria mitis TaxID=44415 RepID=U6JZA8_9EIME|nr:uncharacterized protein EMH_0044320 [Eimeria mitis]CDJ28828.1 hypothetical protein, conserved [Eimeria mitis]